ncbi:gliding motility-associated C-terminal domain-containing protein [Taibaiella koreensis]|uniref:gliding motility-associated C-terminal domain-containing protein n=1 Tax=Taibaiella koreensis TaxID=1268548 RepID=UPI000E59F575|nr:gliding motility-associated C-terminal domain-containing protein [Taibaiella koreensis]
MSRSFTLIAFFFLMALQAAAQQKDMPPPLLFIPNEGQWQEPFLYKGVSASADIYLEKGGITYLVGDETNPAKIHEYKEGHSRQAPVLRYHAYRMKWLGANEQALTEGSKKQSYYHNYFLGNDPSRWKSKVGVFGNVDYKGLYPGIDLHMSSDKGHAKYDFIVYAGSDAAQIRLRFEGLDGISIGKEGNLVLRTSVGEIREMAPYAYQYIGGEMKEVPCRYKLEGNELRFSFPRDFDHSQNLIIDPTIVFATLTGSTADNWGFTATYDAAGNLYSGGIANGLGYPMLGPIQATYGGGTWDIAISKFNASGTGLIYSTYLGGGMDDMPHSLVVDGANELVLAGKSRSTDYPITSGAFDPTHNDSFDIVVTKFNATGTALIGSTYVGGSGNDGININSDFSADINTIKFNYGDNSRSEVIVDRQNNVYVAASSRSNNFPLTANAAKNSLGGPQDGVFFKLNATLSTMLYSTYIGGSSTDAAYALALDTGQTHVYVAGGTQSADFHTTAAATGWRSSYQGGLADGYICRFLNSGAYPLQKATFVGTSAYDQCFGVQCDLENGIYTMGQTLGSFPVSTGVYSNPGSRQFLLKLDSLLGTATYSTVFGSGASNHPNISPVAFLVDTCQNVYISGWGGSITGSTTTGLPVTVDAFQPTTDGNDFYFIVLSKNGLSLLFASFFGSPNKGEHVDGGTSRFDPNGVVYQAICASCGPGSAFPATPGAYATTKGSSNCNLGALKIAFNLGSVKAVAAANPNVTGCAPLTVNFSNGSTNATSYLWDFNDGSSTSTATAPTHIFTDPGTYHVKMVAINPNACKTHDTVTLQIVVSSDTIRANFNLALLDTCTNPRIVITNTSVAMPGHSLSQARFQWFFGDGTSSTLQNPGTHNYAGAGTFPVTMVMTDTAACNSPDTVIKTVVIDQRFLNAGFNGGSFCMGDTALFTNTSVNGDTYQWTFGDGATSTEANGAHMYTAPGTYTVTLRAFNAATCNKTDTAQQTVTVKPNPTAAFSYTPLIPESNVPTSFFNQSVNATRYQWSFGDNAGSEEENPIHSYNRTGDYQVCLTAFNSVGCSHKVCRTIRAEVQPLADVPTGFSPNGDGSNDILYVRGYSIETLDFRIFNRWGEQVFETRNQSVGWDGTYKGKPQNMDAYAFILQVTFYDGTTMRKQGNVTLLR